MVNFKASLKNQITLSDMLQKKIQQRRLGGTKNEYFKRERKTEKGKGKRSQGLLTF